MPSLEGLALARNTLLCFHLHATVLHLVRLTVVLVVFQESLPQVCHELLVVQNLADFHSSEDLFAALALFALDSSLDELACQLVGPSFPFFRAVPKVVPRKDLHILLNTEQGVLDSALLNQREQHSAYIGLPGYFVVLLEHLEPEVLALLSVACDTDRLNQPEKLRINLAQCQLGRQVLGQALEELLSRKD